MMQGGKSCDSTCFRSDHGGALTFSRDFGKLRAGARRLLEEEPHALLARTLALLGPLVLALPAPAQEFPSRPITLICPWPPGGSTDTHLRRFAEIATKYLGRQS